MIHVFPAFEDDIRSLILAAVVVVESARSISPEISSVAGLRSGIAAFIEDSFSHGRSVLRDPSGGRFGLPGKCRGRVQHVRSVIPPALRLTASAPQNVQPFAPS